MAKEKKGVKIDHVSKIYQDPKTGKDFYAVHDANIDIAPGEFVCLLGPSGCGKTTILRMIAGFESPDEGEIYLGGEPINDLTPNKRDTAMVFQSYALLPHYNIYDNVAYGLKLRKMDEKTIKEKVTRILGLVGLEGMENRMTNQLSGGQQQRVALARALVIEPGVLLFDEPLSNLDAKLRVDMRNEIRRIQQEAGITAIYVTHDQSEAMAISDQIIIMKKGVVDQIGDPHTVYYRPIDEFVADFIGESNILNGIMLEDRKVKFHGHVFECVDSGFEKNEPVDVVVRPEDVDIVPEEKGMLRGVVTSVTFLGVHYEIIVDVQGFKWMIQTTDFCAVDSHIGLFIEPDAIQIMHKSKYSGMFGDYSSFSNEFDELSDAAAEVEEE